jgi:PLP dependent protein
VSTDSQSLDSPSLDLQNIGERITQIRASIPPEVRLIAVTKTVSVEKMRAAYAAGIRDFGENRVQEALAKQEVLQDLPQVTWHLIGPLQRNKVRKAVEHFDWIHSVDSLPLAERIASIAQDLNRSPRICLQVKLRPDPQKIGWAPEDLRLALPHLAALPALKICGLMSIPPLHTDPEETLKIFGEVRDLAKNLTGLSDLCFQELSLGMSGDYPLAIQSGATMIRLGSILFGDRP